MAIFMAVVDWGQPDDDKQVLPGCPAGLHSADWNDTITMPSTPDYDLQRAGAAPSNLG